MMVDAHFFQIMQFLRALMTLLQKGLILLPNGTIKKMNVLLIWLHYSQIGKGGGNVLYVASHGMRHQIKERTDRNIRVKKAK
jgi:hypothetical protein